MWDPNPDSGHSGATDCGKNYPKDGEAYPKAGCGAAVGGISCRDGEAVSGRKDMDQRDLVKALMLLAEKGIAGEVYNISSVHIYQMKDIVLLIEKQIGHELNLSVD